MPFPNFSRQLTCKAQYLIYSWYMYLQQLVIKSTLVRTQTHLSPSIYNVVLGHEPVRHTLADFLCLHTYGSTHAHMPARTHTHAHVLLFARFFEHACACAWCVRAVRARVGAPFQLYDACTNMHVHVASRQVVDC